MSAALVGVRHASSTPQELAKSAPPLSSSPVDSATPAAAATSPPTVEPPAFPNIDTISLDDIDLTTVADIPEQIGYLHALGLNYGYGMTSVLEWTIEHLHIVGGLPWWGSLAATAALLRIFLFPLYVRASDSQARLQAISSVLKPFNERIEAAKRSGDRDEMLGTYREMLQTRQRAGISLRAQFLPMFVQGYFAYCGFRLIRAMVNVPVPALKTEGPLWLQDLTLTDPYLLLPLAMAGTVHLLIRMGGESGAQSSSQISPGMQKFMLWGMPGIIVLAMGYQSAALCVWFAAGGAMGVSQALILRQPRVRQYLGIAPLYTPTEEEQTRDALSTMMNPFGKKTSSPETATTTRRPSTGGKNAAFMNPTYQSPNLRRTTTDRPFKKKGEVIDVVAKTSIGASSPKAAWSQPAPASSADSDMIQPNKPQSQGVLGEAAKSWNNLKKWSHDTVNGTEEQRAAKNEEDRRTLKKREAENYEQRAQKRKKGGKSR